jgi:large subunit ribosomal protein L11
MAQPWTSKLVIKALGVAKCNGSMEAATENLTLEQAIGVAQEKSAELTGNTLKAKTREVIGTCVSMRVKIDGHWPKEALEIIARGEWDERFN